MDARFGEARAVYRDLMTTPAGEERERVDAILTGHGKHGFFPLLHPEPRRHVDTRRRTIEHEPSARRTRLHFARHAQPRGHDHIDIPVSERQGDLQIGDGRRHRQRLRRFRRLQRAYHEAICRPTPHHPLLVGDQPVPAPDLAYRYLERPIRLPR